MLPSGNDYKPTLAQRGSAGCAATRNQGCPQPDRGMPLPRIIPAFGIGPIAAAVPLLRYGFARAAELRVSSPPPAS